MSKTKFSPSLMCMDLLDIKNQIEVLNKYADMYHVDIMDGHYVNNLAFSPDFIKAIKKITTVSLDCHLMVTNPYDYIDALAEAGADYICPHAETLNSIAFRTINRIKELGCKVGVVLNPETPVEYIQHYIHLLDKITVMSVDPGFAGQPFIREMLDKIKKLKELKHENGYKYLIEIDGSANKKTFKELNEAGVEVFIVGASGLFNLCDNIEDSWNKMQEIFDEETKPYNEEIAM
jgi:D-allulose-6-phosphate 3-epimerase